MIRERIKSCVHKVRAVADDEWHLRNSNVSCVQLGYEDTAAVPPSLCFVLNRDDAVNSGKHVRAHFRELVAGRGVVCVSFHYSSMCARTMSTSIRETKSEFLALLSLPTISCRSWIQKMSNNLFF